MHRTKPLVLSALALAMALPGSPGWAGLLEDPPEAAEWVTTSTADEAYRAVIASPDGATVFAAGHRWESGMHALIRAFDADTGAVLWTFLSTRESSSVTVLAVSADGTRLVAGGTAYADRSKMALWALDADDGTSRWSATHAGNGARHRESIVRDLAFGAGGTRVLAAGTAWYEARRRDFVVLAYDAATGRSMWKRVYDSGGSDSLGRSDEAQALAITPNGTAVIATGIGRWPAGEPQGQALTMAFRIANGERRWLRYDQPAGADDWQGGKDVSMHGESVFVGAQGLWNYGLGFGDLGVARMRTSDGRRNWQRELTPTGERCHLVGIAADAEGLHAGASCAAEDGPQQAIVWSRQLGDGTGRWLARAGSDLLTMGFATTEARILVAGTERSSTSSVQILGFSKADGQQILVGHADGSVLSEERSLAVSLSDDAAYAIGSRNNLAALFRFDIP